MFLLPPQTSCGVCFSSSRIHVSPRTSAKYSRHLRSPINPSRLFRFARSGVREVCSKYRVKQVSERSYPANFIEKIDEFINLPRGFGKSLTYQALPLICDTVRGTTGHIVVVVSPLVNLMKDQATKLTNISML